MIKNTLSIIFLFVFIAPGFAQNYSQQAPIQQYGAEHLLFTSPDQTYDCDTVHQNPIEEDNENTNTPTKTECYTTLSGETKCVSY